MKANVLQNKLVKQTSKTIFSSKYVVDDTEQRHITDTNSSLLPIIDGTGFRVQST